MDTDNALRDFNHAINIACGDDEFNRLSFYELGLEGKDIEAIQFALKFTKAALSGDVSDEVMKAATDSYSINGRFALLSHYKAMSQQLAKEIG